MTATARLAEFVVKTTLRDCPDAALAQVRRAALDTLGVMLAGAAEPVAASVRAVARAEGGTPLCTVLGTLAAHVADRGPRWPTAPPATPTTSTTPTSRCWATRACRCWPPPWRRPRPSRPTAPPSRSPTSIGFEVSAALGRRSTPATTRAAGTPRRPSARSAARPRPPLLGLDVGQTRHALGIAASLASGLKENFGSMTKPFHAGHAARNGVFAAHARPRGAHRLRRGARGPSGLRWPRSAGRRWRAAPSTGSAGAGSSLDSGIAVKPYPSCALTHSAIDALLDLRARHGLDAGRRWPTSRSA